MEPKSEKICKILLLFLITLEVPRNKMPRNKRIILQIFAGFGSVRVIPTMRLHFLRENLNLATESDDVVIHTLNNDIPGLENHVGLARNFCDVLLEFRERRRKSKVFVSLLLTLQILLFMK